MSQKRASFAGSTHIKYEPSLPDHSLSSDTIKNEPLLPDHTVSSDSTSSIESPVPSNLFRDDFSVSYDDVVNDISASSGKESSVDSDSEDELWTDKPIAGIFFSCGYICFVFFMQLLVWYERRL